VLCYALDDVADVRIYVSDSQLVPHPRFVNMQDEVLSMSLGSALLELSRETCDQLECFFPADVQSDFRIASVQFIVKISHLLSASFADSLRLGLVLSSLLSASPFYLLRDFFGLPPFAPFLRAAAVFAADVA
jgi:hypothetical protein